MTERVTFFCNCDKYKKRVMIKKVIKIVFVSLVSLISLWFCCAWLLPKIKTNQEVVKSQKTITIYVKSNGNSFLRFDDFLICFNFWQKPRTTKP